MTTPHPGQARLGVLFVCLGNICRSPLAEALFIHHARARNILDRFDVDSCGTGHWHAGDPADPRSIAVALRNNIPITHTARQFDAASDLPRFEHLIAMDRSNIRNLVAMGAPRQRIHLLRSFDPSAANLVGEGPREGPDVPDPYYGNDAGFDEVFTMCNIATAHLIDFLLDQE